LFVYFHKIKDYPPKEPKWIPCKTQNFDSIPFYISTK